MAEGVVSSIAQGILTTMGSRVLQEVGLWWGVSDELEKLRKTISTIQAVLLDAEDKYLESNQVREWLGQLKEVFYEADDLLDDFSTEALRQKVMSGGKIAKEVRLFFSSSNQVIYGLKMAHKTKDIRGRLDEIANSRKFHLVERPLEKPVMPKDREQTHSHVPHIVVGRDDDKNAIIDLLMKNSYEDNVVTIPIVGIGGLGKTTLAQLVFNDEKVKAHFELRMWVCVADHFDVKLIVEKIIVSGAWEKPRDLEMDPLVNLLYEKINGKRYLLVLDDVWNEDIEKWSRLKDLLVGGARGSKIIITTRMDKVSEISHPVKVHKLQGLSNRDSWELFTKMTFKIGEVPSDRHKKIGEEIIRRCKGVPLAIKAMGSLLYFKPTIEEWLSFKNKELLKIGVGETNIFLILKLSYDHLPFELKNCFAYCCLFPKDHIIHVPTLINLWMAQGYIKPSGLSECLEDIGHEYFMELLWRSFFQEVQKDYWGNIETCKMHDLMHDLATQVAGKEIVVWNFNGEFVNGKSRHASFHYDNLLSSSWRVPPSLLESRDLRTFLLLHGSKGEFQSSSELEKKQLDVIFSNLRSLRVLDLHNLSINKVPDSLNKMKHLRHVDLSYNWCIKVLPDSITMLQNLQVLVLDWCYNLQQLPKDTKKLVNLCQLSLSGCRKLGHMPRGLGRLTSLTRLSRFVVGSDESGAALDELGALNNLRGELVIVGLEMVNSQAQFRAANLKEKQHLQKLSSAFYTDYKMVHDMTLEPVEADEMALEAQEMALEALEPHQNLKGIEVSYYGGLKFPMWISSLSNLVEISLSWCVKCEYLIPLYQLPYLRSLSISFFDSLEYIEQEEIKWDDDATPSFFPSLEILRLEACYNLKGWWKKTASSSLLPRFSQLSELNISLCPKMTLMPLFPPLKTLHFGDGSVNSLEEILNSTSFSSSSSASSSILSIALSQLQVLNIGWIDDMEFLPEGLVRNLISLKTLSLYGCPRLKSISQAMQHLTSLEKLSIASCYDLNLNDYYESEDDDDESVDVDQKMQWQALQTLRSLEFHYLPRLVSLPMWTQDAPALQELHIEYCHNLKSLPEWMPKLTSLQKLIIHDCSRQLEERCGSNNGEDWPKIAHIPNIKVDEKVVQRNGRYLL